MIFNSPVDGAVNPMDGQLYSRIPDFWTTAKQISGPGATAHTGVRSTLPRESVRWNQGILLRFDVTLTRKKAAIGELLRRTMELPAHSELWFAALQTRRHKGQDSMRAEQCVLLEGWEKCVHWIPDMKPVIEIVWAGRSRRATVPPSNKNTLFHSIRTRPGLIRWPRALGH